METTIATHRVIQMYSLLTRERKRQYEAFKNDLGKTNREHQAERRSEMLDTSLWQGTIGKKRGQTLRTTYFD